MSTADTYVRARIDTNTKERAAEALGAMGLSISDAIRLLMLRVADERLLPFEIKVPGAIPGQENKGILTVDRAPSRQGTGFAAQEVTLGDSNAPAANLNVND